MGKKPPRFRVLPSFKSRVFAQRCHLTQHHLGSHLSHRGLLLEHSWHRVQACKPASNCVPLPPPLPPMPPTAVMWQCRNPHSLVLAGCRDGDSRSQGSARPRHRWGTKRGGHPVGPGTCPLPCQICTPKPPQHPLAAEQWAVPGARAWHPTQTRNILQKQRDLKKISSAETQAKREEFPEVPKSLFSASVFQITLLLYSPMCCMLKIHRIHREKNPHQSKIQEH